MSTLNTSAIKAAKLGSTDLQAVYKGSVKVWEKTTPAPTEVKEFWSIIPVNPTDCGYEGWEDNNFWQDICYGSSFNGTYYEAHRSAINYYPLYNGGTFVQIIDNDF